MKRTLDCSKTLYLSCDFIICDPGFGFPIRHRGRYWQERCFSGR